MKKFFLLAAAAVLALVGCQKQNQTSLDFDKVEKTATVSGTLVAYYDAPGAATQTIALAGVRLYVQVGAAKYMDGAAGNKQFQTTTDAEGKFEIKVKTGAKEIGDAKLKSDDFKYQIGDANIYYEAVDYPLDALNEGDIRLEYVVANPDAVLNQTVGEGTLTGKVTYDAGTIKKSDGTLEQKTHAYANDALVIAAVKYFAGTPDEVVKNFTTKANASGVYTFAIPVEVAGNDIELTLGQKKYTYTQFANNAWATQECYYTLTAAVPANVKANETTVQDLAFDQRDAIEADTKTQVSFTVKATVKKQAEMPKYDKSDKLTEYIQDNVVTSDYPITIQVDYYDDAKTNIISTILYEGQKVGDKGAFSATVKLYDGWEISRVKVSAYADKTVKLAPGEFKHYYNPLDQETKKYAAKIDDWTSQKDLEGVYLGGKDNVLGSQWATDNQLFFSLDLGDLVLEFEPESKAKLLGVACKASDPGAVECDGTGAGAYYPANQAVDIDGKKYALGISGLAWPWVKP